MNSGKVIPALSADSVFLHNKGNSFNFYTTKKTNKQVLNNLLRMEQNVKESKLKNPVWDLTLNNPVRSAGL